MMSYGDLNWELCYRFFPAGYKNPSALNTQHSSGSCSWNEPIPRA